MINIEERPAADRIEGIALPADCLSVVGHDSNIEQLFSAFKSQRMHHAWLLSGPRGIGKASLALLFAKYIFANPDQQNLSDRFDAETIPETIHRQVAQGAHPQLLHLTRPWDEKTKRFKTQLSVEEIRRTQSFYGMTAGAGGWRVTIVDSVDDMNASAANALLKMLEEPPKKSLFFVLSHATGRPLATIRSRCQKMSVAPLSGADLRSVLDELGIQASDADKARAVEFAEGSVRRAIQIIESSVMKDFVSFEKLMEAGSTGSGEDWKTAHRIAESLSRRGQEEAYMLFDDLVTAWIGKQLRHSPDQDLAKLAGWANVWDKANRSTRLADAFNLDKKQVILSLFGYLFERNRNA
ncbi:MAG: DNA polymerase III subunit delta' [Rhizobiaceae bacterium]